MSETKKKFSASEGWLRMDLTMKTKKPRSEEELKRIASFGKPDDYEWGKVEQYGAVVKIICRELEKPVLDAQPEPSATSVSTKQP